MHERTRRMREDLVSELAGLAEGTTVWHGGLTIRVLPDGEFLLSDEWEFLPPGVEMESVRAFVQKDGIPPEDDKWWVFLDACRDFALVAKGLK